MKHLFTAWTIDGMEKVFADTEPGPHASTEIELRGAGGECEVAQIAVQAGSEDILLHKPVIGALRSDNSEIAATHITCRFVELVPVRFASQGISPENQVRAAPDFFPDPLCLEDKMIVPAGQTRAVWICIGIPRDAEAGAYRGQITVRTSGGEKQVDVALTVWPFCLPEHIPFEMTAWVWPAIISRYHSVKLYSEEFWELIEAYAADMEAHRQNVIYTHIIGRDSLIKVTRTKSGNYTFDFSDFDRWVELFLKRNFQVIEGTHLLGTTNRYTVTLWDEAGEENVVVQKRSTKSRIEPHEEYLGIVRALMPALRDHLRTKGWESRYIQHIADEPSGGEKIRAYLYMVELVRHLWPEVRLVEAADTDPVLFEAGDVLVPLCDHRSIFDDIDTYLEKGKTVWAYTCNHPRGRYPGVFLDQPLILTRIMPWIMWRYGVTGFLYYALGHWAIQYRCDRYNHDTYTGELRDERPLYNPWTDPAMNATWQCPPGSWGFVYPPRDPQAQDPDTYVPRLVENFNRTRDGLPSAKEDEGPAEAMTKVLPGVVDSIRWEQLREGIEDYGLLCCLKAAIEQAMTDPATRPAAEKAGRIMGSVVMEIAPDWENYTREPADIYKARQRLAEEIETLNELTK